MTETHEHLRHVLEKQLEDWAPAGETTAQEIHHYRRKVDEAGKILARLSLELRSWLHERAELRETGDASLIEGGLPKKLAEARKATEEPHDVSLKEKAARTEREAEEARVELARHLEEKEQAALDAAIEAVDRSSAEQPILEEIRQIS